MNTSASTTKGVILIDILLALALGVLFIIVIAVSSSQAEDIFSRAQARDILLGEYEAVAPELNALAPYAHAQFSDVLASAIPYGNDMVETDISIATTSPGFPSLSFSTIRTASTTLSDSEGMSECSVDYMKGPAYAAPTITQINLSMIKATIPLTDLQVRDGMAFISADSSVGYDPDLFIVDIHNPAAPLLKSSITTGVGITAIALGGTRVFAAVPSTAGQLQVINASTVSAPFLEGKYRLTPKVASDTPPVGTAVSFRSNIAYLGTEKWAEGEFSALDVSVPSNPQKVGSFVIGGKVNRITLNGSVAYVAAAGPNQLSVLNVSNTSTPLLVSVFSPSGSGRQEGEAVASFEGELNLARTDGGYDIITDPEVFSWASTSVAGLSPYTSLDVPGGVYGIVTDRNHTYLATRESGQEFQIFDPGLSASSSRSYPLPMSVQSMTCDGGHIYILALNSHLIYDITFN